VGRSANAGTNAASFKATIDESIYYATFSRKDGGGQDASMALGRKIGGCQCHLLAPKKGDYELTAKANCPKQSDTDAGEGAMSGRKQLSRGH
jgi:hypothetical protein